MPRHRYLHYDVFTPLETRRAVDRVRFELAGMRPIFARHRLDDLPVFIFSLDAGHDDATVYSRMFAPAFGIPEDAATGGASGPLGAYLVHHGAVPSGTAQMVSLQGVKMGRPSRVHISISSSASSEDGDITSVQVGGVAVLVAEGALYLLGGARIILSCRRWSWAATPSSRRPGLAVASRVRTRTIIGRNLAGLRVREEVSSPMGGYVCVGLRTLTKIKSPFWPPMHPAPRRCSLRTYSRYARSSRLAGQAPRHPEGGNFILISVLRTGGLGPSSASRTPLGGIE